MLFMYGREIVIVCVDILCLFMYFLHAIHLVGLLCMIRYFKHVMQISLHSILTRFMHYRAMAKVSFPEDRAELRKRLPEVLTKLEIMLPIQWNTIVMHILNFHNLEQFEAAGPYTVSNLLEIERYHTRFKSHARGKTNIMASIKNHHSLMEASDCARLDDEMAWTMEPPRSSVSGLASRLDSADRAERVCSPLGASTPFTLPADCFQQLQTLWADSYPVYKELHKKYNRDRIRYGIIRHGIHRRTLTEWVDSKAWATAEEKAWARMTPEIEVGSFGYGVHISVRNLVLTVYRLFNAAPLIYVWHTLSAQGLVQLQRMLARTFDFMHHTHRSTRGCNTPVQRSERGSPSYS